MHEVAVDSSCGQYSHKYRKQNLFNVSVQLWE